MHPARLACPVGSEVSRTPAGRQVSKAVATVDNRRVVRPAAPVERAGRSTAYSVDRLIAAFDQCADNLRADTLECFFVQSLRRLRREE